MGIPATLSSVPAQTPYIQYVATSSQTVFPYPFEITQDSDLVVVINGVTQATDSGYSLSGVGNSTGGNLTFTSGRTSGDIVTLYRDIAIERVTQIGQNSGFSATTFNAEFNNIYLLLQQLAQSANPAGFSLQVPNTNSPAPTTMLLPGAYANKYLSFDANGNPTPALLTSSGSLTQAILGGLLFPQTAVESAAGVTPTNYAYPDGNVLRYGADPTGVADCTAAFNTACFATYGSWTPTTRPRRVTVPAGRYKFAGINTVYVRSGMTLQGEGQGAVTLDLSAWGASASDAFRLGWGNISGTPTQDSGGFAPEMAGFQILGGPSGGGAAIGARFPGTIVRDCFLSACGLGVYTNQGGLVSGVTFDTGLAGLTIGGGSNTLVENCQFFNQNYQIQFDNAATSDISDVNIVGCQFEYPKYASVLLGSGGTANFQGVKFAACKFLMNVQYGTYVNFVSLSPSNTAQFEFANCDFRNWGAGGAGPYYAVSLNGSSLTVDLNNCIFDGLRSNSTYNQSAATAGVQLQAGTLRINGGVMRNLNSYGVQWGGTHAGDILQIKGLSYQSIGGASFVNVTHSQNDILDVNGLTGDGVTTLVNNQALVRLSVKSSTGWFGGVGLSGSSNYVLVPYQNSNMYMITLSANQNVGGSGHYSKSRLDALEKDNDFATSAKSFLTQTTIVQGAANTNGTLTLTCEFGSVGGGTTIATSDSGSLAVSWPDTYSAVSLDVQMIQSAIN